VRKRERDRKYFSFLIPTNYFVEIFKHEMSISSYTRNFEDNKNNKDNNSRETMIEEFYFDPKTNSTSATPPVRKLSSSSSSLYYDINQQPSTILLPTNIRSTTSPNSQTNNISSNIKNVPISYTSSEYVTTTGPNNHINTTSTITSSRSPHLSTPQLKCNRCDKLTRKFESLINCTNPSCGKLFHKRCVIFPYASNERDNVWKCEDCESIYGVSYKPQTALIRSGTSLKNLQSRPALAHSHTTSSLSGLPSFKYEDGRTHICNKVHTPRSTTRNFYYSRDSTNNSNTPTLSPRLNHKNSASVGSLDQKTFPVKYQDQDILSKYDYFYDKKTKPNETELELKLAQMNDIKNEMNAKCEDIAAVQQNQASSSLQYLPSVDDQNKIFVKLNIRTLDEDEEKEEIEKLTNKNYEFILNDTKDNLSKTSRRSSNKHMQSPPPPPSQSQVRTESRKSSQSDANNKLKTEKEKLINEIEINEDMIKNFDKQFESLISKNIVSDLENSSQKLNKFQTYEENRAYINGQLKASNSNSGGAGEANNWILKPTTTIEPPFLFRYNKPEPPQSHTFFHYSTNEEEEKDYDGEEEEQIVEIEEDEQQEEELINDVAYNNQLINYDNENKNLINFTTFNKKEDQNINHLKNTKYEEDKNKLENFYNCEDEDHDTTKEEETTVINISDNNYKSNYRIGQTIYIIPGPVPPPPPAPSNMTSFQQVSNNNQNKQPAPACQTSHQVDAFRMKEMEKKIVYQDEKLRAQEEKIEELTNVIRKLSKDFELQKTTSSLKPKKTENNNNNNQVKKPDAFEVARNEGIKEDDAWRISLIDDLSLIFAKYLVRVCIFYIY
jgi:hypothetical protein